MEKDFSSKGIACGYLLEDAMEYGINEAIILNRLRWLTKFTKREDGFVWQTANDWLKYTGLSERKVSKAVQNLVNANVIEKKVTYIQDTSNRATHYRFVGLKNSQNELSESDETDISETDKKCVSIETDKKCVSNIIKNNIIKNNNNNISVINNTNKNECVSEISKEPKKYGNENVNRLMNVIETDIGIELKRNNRYERFSANRLIKKYGIDNLVAMVRLAKYGLNDRYCPKITSVRALEDKYYNLILWAKNKQDDFTSNDISDLEGLGNE